jgi:TonB family protein
MFIRQALLCIAVLAASSIVFAQSSETQPKASDRVEILTDTMGVDFGPYLKGIVPIVKKNWYSLMPLSVYPPVFKQGKVSIEFAILKDGKVDDIKLDTSSRDAAMDQAAWGSITASTFPPLPEEFPGKLIRLRFRYFYNLTANPHTYVPGLSLVCRFSLSTISISPCADVRVPAGSTLKFVASGKDITNASVTWGVSGPGCSKLGCGSISDTGFYTAPVNVPDPPNVSVKATSRADTSVTATSEVIVVQAKPPH